jgi:hypothetical protein
MCRRHCLIWVIGTCLLLGWASPLPAQLNRGVIEGIVTDPQGGVVPGVAVTITNVETSVSTSTKTNGAGYYHVPDLVPGKYRAHFVASGFSALDLEAIEVLAGQVLREDAQLKIGATSQRIEVTAGAQVVETAAANFSTTLQSTLIQSLPLAGHDLQQLVFLMPGVNVLSGPPGSNFGFNSEFGTFPDPTHVFGSDVSVNGGQGGANAWYLDGNLNLVGFAENVAVNPSPDAVSEFQTITNAFSAEYSRTGGAVFNVVLKSGTNAFHGSLYEYVRNSATNARNPFTSIDSSGNIIPQNQLRYNDFGGTLGGPVMIPHLYNGKNRTFFFFSSDTSILHLKGNNVFTVPTAQMRQGNFSEDPNVVQYGIWDPNSTAGPDVNGLYQRTAFGTPVPGNPFGANGCLNTSVETGAGQGVKTCNFATQVPTSRLDPTAMFFIQSFPLPNHIDTTGSCPLAASGGVTICNNFLGPVASSQDVDNFSIKIDHAWSDKSKYFGEWLYSPAKYDNFRVPWTGPTFPMDFVGFNSNYPVDLGNQNIGLGNTYTIRPTLVNEFRASFTRQFLTTHPEHPYPESISHQSEVQTELAPLGIPEDHFFPTPNWQITSTPGGGYIPFGPTAWVNMATMAEAYTILDNVTKVMGKHTLKTGFVYRLEHTAYESGYPTIFYFTGGLVQDPTSGLGASALTQFMLGAVANDGSSGTGVTSAPYERFRYWGFYGQDDFRITPNFTLNLGLRYDLYGLFRLRQTPASNFCLGCSNSVTGLPGKLIYVGDPQWPGGGQDIAPPTYNNFAPRINFSWSPFADRKTVIRGGFDIFNSNALAGINAPGQGAANEPGWSVGYSWIASGNPSQCGPIGSGACVAFPLSDTTTNKASLTTPPYTRVLPAQNRASLLGLTGIDPFVPPSHDPTVEMWNLEIERQLPGNIGLTVGYVGNHSTHLLGSDNFYNYLHTKDILQYKTLLTTNVPITSVYSGQTAAALQQVYAGTSALQLVNGVPEMPLSVLLRSYPFYDALGSSGLYSFSDFQGKSIYHGMNLRVQKQASHGLQFIVAFTVSKLISSPFVGQTSRQTVDPIHYSKSGNIGGRAGEIAFAGGGGYGVTYQDRDNLKVDRSISAEDIPQMLNIASTYELPFGAGKALLNRKGVLNGVLGGWRLSGNFNAESGTPLAITGPCDNLQIAEVDDGCRVNVVGNPGFSGSRSKAQRIADWINPAAFQPVFGSDQSFWGNGYNPQDPRAWLFAQSGPLLPNFRAPGFWNLDASLGKDFHLGDQVLPVPVGCVQRPEPSEPGSAQQRFLPAAPTGWNGRLGTHSRLPVWPDHRHPNRPARHGVRFEVLLVGGLYSDQVVAWSVHFGFFDFGLRREPAGRNPKQIPFSRACGIRAGFRFAALGSEWHVIPSAARELIFFARGEEVRD